MYFLDTVRIKFEFLKSQLSMHLIPALRFDIQMYILVITSLYFPRFFKISEVTIMGTVTVMGVATL